MKCQTALPKNCKSAVTYPNEVWFKQFAAAGSFKLKRDAAVKTN
jgi:hypothetical protein